MENEKLMSIMSRVFFFGALFFLGLSVVQKGLNLLGVVSPLDIGPRDLLDWTVPLLLFVIAIVVRQMREELKRA